MSESDNDPFADYPDVTRAVEYAPPSANESPPASVVESLERERRSALRERGVRRPTRRFIPLGIAAAAAVLVVGWFGFLRSDSPDGPPPMANVTITSPGDRIEDTRPSVRWTSRDEPGQRYDVWILPEEGDYLEASTLFVARGVTSPVAFDRLEPGPGVPPDGDLEAGAGYRVLVCLADRGRMSGTPVPFRVKEKN